MSWEIEYQHVDLAEMEHVTGFIEKSVITRNGKPAQHLLQVRLGDDLKLQPDGRLLRADGTEYDVKAKQREVLQELNALHAAARKYAEQRRAEIFKGPKK